MGRALVGEYRSGVYLLVVVVFGSGSAFEQLVGLGAGRENSHCFAKDQLMNNALECTRWHPPTPGHYFSPQRVPRIHSTTLGSYVSERKVSRVGDVLEQKALLRIDGGLRIAWDVGFMGQLVCRLFVAALATVI